MKVNNRIIFVILIIIIFSCANNLKNQEYYCFVQNSFFDYNLHIDYDKDLLKKFSLGIIDEIIPLRNDSYRKFEIAFRISGNKKYFDIPVKKGETLFLGRFTKDELSRIKLDFINVNGEKILPYKFIKSDSETLFTKPADYP